MLLSSNVIKKVSCELENCSVYPKMAFSSKEQEKQTPLFVDLESLKREADVILLNARAEAEILLQQTYARIADIEKEAYAKGYQKGEQDACETEEKARADFYKATKKILQEIEEIQDNIYRDTEAELIDLAVGIAEKLVCRQLDIKPETIVDIVKAACGQARDCKQIILYVSPEQLDNVKAKQGEIGEQLYRTEHFAIIADSNIEFGGCRIETEQGYIDASRATMSEQLDKIIKDYSQ